MRDAGLETSSLAGLFFIVLLMFYNHYNTTTMKNLFLITLSILLLASCGKTPQNGNLDGQWIMQEMYSKKDVNSTEYIKADRANPTIWNVSLSMILISTLWNQSQWSNWNHNMQNDLQRR